MPSTSAPDPSDPPPSPARRKFLRRISSLPIKPAARDHYVRWAEAWTKARGHRSADATRRSSTPLAAPLPSCRLAIPPGRGRRVDFSGDVLTTSWAQSFDWQSCPTRLSPSNPNTAPSLARPSLSCPHFLRRQKTHGPLARTGDEITRIMESLRRAIRLAGHRHATEETYVHWIARFTRFCLVKARTNPQMPGRLPSPPTSTILPSSAMSPPQLRNKPSTPWHSSPKTFSASGNSPSNISLPPVASVVRLLS